MTLKYIGLPVLIIFSCVHTFAQKDGPVLKVDGDVKNPLQLSLADLAKLKRDTASLSGHDNARRVFTGVPVSAILELAGVTTGKDLHGKNFAKYLLVKCSDGYSVLFSLAELDASIIDKRIILADRSDGEPLPVDRGPLRLVIPGEKRPARSCYQVVSFTIGMVGDK